jgi:hypothetical protein
MDAQRSAWEGTRQAGLGRCLHRLPERTQRRLNPAVQHIRAFSSLYVILAKLPGGAWQPRPGESRRFLHSDPGESILLDYSRRTRDAQERAKSRGGIRCDDRCSDLLELSAWPRVTERGRQAPQTRSTATCRPRRRLLKPAVVASPSRADSTASASRRRPGSDWQPGG